MSLVDDGRADSWIDPSNEDKRGTRLLAHILLALVLTIGIVFFLWANQAVLDEVTLGEGRVIPSSTVQVIQNLEGGIVSEIMVREGQIVEPGEALMRLENIVADTSRVDLTQRRLTNVDARCMWEADPDRGLERLRPGVIDESRDLSVRPVHRNDADVAT